MQRPTVERRLRGAEQIGTLILLNRILVLLPTIQLATLTLPLFLTHGGISWDMPKARKIAPRGMPSPAELQRYQAIGRIYLAAGLILALIPPPDYQT